MVTWASGIRARISRLISLALIGMGVCRGVVWVFAWPRTENSAQSATTMRRGRPSVNPGGLGGDRAASVQIGHIGRQPSLEPLLEVGDANWALALERNNGAPGGAEGSNWHARCTGTFEYRLGQFRSDHVTRLVLAEPESVGGNLARGLQDRPDAGCDRHFGHSHENTAIGDVVRGGDKAVADQAAHEVAMPALGGEIHRRRSTLLPPANLAQIHRLPQPAAGLANEEDRIALALERSRHGLGEFIEQSDAADRWCRQNGAAIGFVIERDIPRHDWKVERATGLADAAHTADELTHDLRPLRIAEVEIVGERQRLRTDCAEIAPRLGDRLLAALERIGLTIARRHIGGQRQGLGTLVDAHDRGIAARPLYGVTENNVIVLLPDPALAAQIRRANQRFECVRDRNRRLDGGRIKFSLFAQFGKWPLIDRRFVTQFLDRQIGDDAAAVAHHEALAGSSLADDGEIESPLAEDCLGFCFLFRLEHHEHALLALGQHHLIGAHAGFTARHFVEIKHHAKIALGAHLHRRTGQPSRTHILNGDDAALGHYFEAGFKQQLFREWIADLHGGPLLLGICAEFSRRHSRTVNAVAAGFGAEINDRHADARRLGVEDLVALGEAHRHRVDEAIAVIASVEADFAADRRHAEGVAVTADSGDHAGNERARLGMFGIAERQRVEAGYRPRAHREHVAQNSADTRRRALVWLDIARMIVALHLEYDGEPVADIDDAGVLARPLDHPRRLSRQRAQMNLGRFIRAMLVPHRRENAELGKTRFAAEQFENALVLLGREAVLGDQFGGNGRFVWDHAAALK